jgi:hypothetical protein
MPDVGHYRMKGLAALRHCAGRGPMIFEPDGRKLT